MYLKKGGILIEVMAAIIFHLCFVVVAAAPVFFNLNGLKLQLLFFLNLFLLYL